jgi:hypothetical protein
MNRFASECILLCTFICVGKVIVEKGVPPFITVIIGVGLIVYGLSHRRKVRQ